MKKKNISQNLRLFIILINKKFNLLYIEESFL